ncbi:hypothetical protein POTOM_061266 [Populus tomentosa]|uniref:Uncharacterized protein n=1 Tax=Populus tomentosa TaxID=118781 RepID=A0A8X8BYG8_POPTO|nr:hypothetical protein POTOM_061266 [Populus tomentosa]
MGASRSKDCASRLPKDLLSGVLSPEHTLGGLRHPSHVTTPSPSCDSFSKEHLPRVRSSIQINIGEATMLVVLTKDVVEDTLTTNLPVIENAQGATREACSPSIGGDHFSTKLPPPSLRMEDIFSNLRLDRASICFLILNEEENGIMETILQRRSMLGCDGLDMMETLEKLLILPFNVRGLTDPKCQRHLAITRLMTFQIFMMHVYFKNRLVEEKRAMEEVIKQYRASKFEFRRLKEKKDAQDVEMDSLRTTYSKGS